MNSVQSQRIAHYLSGRMSEPDLRAFEAELQRSPELVHEMEDSLRLREGLAVLRDRGRLDTRGKLPLNRAWLGMAAAVAVAAVAATLWRFEVPRAPALIFASRPADAPVTTREVLTLIQRRGSDLLQVTEPRPDSLVAVQVRPVDASPSGKYRVSLRIADRGVRAVAELSDVAVGSDGWVQVYVRGRALAKGRYTLALDPMSGTTPATQFDFAVVSTPGEERASR
jgi:hypothetical protein